MASALPGAAAAQASAKRSQQKRSPVDQGCVLSLAARWARLERSGQIETISVHHLGPCGDKVADKLFTVVVLSIELGIGPQDRV